METPRLSDMTVDDLWQLLQERIRALVQQAMREATTETELRHSDLSDFPVISVGAWPEDLSLRREDMYGDDER